MHVWGFSMEDRTLGISYFWYLLSVSSPTTRMLKNITLCRNINMENQCSLNQTHGSFQHLSIHVGLAMSGRVWRHNGDLWPLPVCTHWPFAQLVELVLRAPTWWPFSRVKDLLFAVNITAIMPLVQAHLGFAKISLLLSQSINFSDHLILFYNWRSLVKKTFGDWNDKIFEGRTRKAQPI